MVTVEVPEIKIKKEPVILPSERTALIIVDMQNDFVDPKGKLYVSTAQKTISAIKKLLEKARKSNVLIIFTQDTHYPGDPEFKIWGEHTAVGTWGHQIIDELKPMFPKEIVIQKMRYDSFFGTPLNHILRIKNIEYVILTGTVANICVLHTAASAALNMYKIILPIDTISALTEFDMYMTLRQVDFIYKGVLTESKYLEFK